MEHCRIVAGNEKVSCGVVIATGERKSTGLEKKEKNNKSGQPADLYGCLLD